MSSWASVRRSPSDCSSVGTSRETTWSFVVSASSALSISGRRSGGPSHQNRRQLRSSIDLSTLSSRSSLGRTPLATGKRESSLSPHIDLRSSSTRSTMRPWSRKRPISSARICRTRVVVATLRHSTSPNCSSRGLVGRRKNSSTSSARRPMRSRPGEPWQSTTRWGRLGSRSALRMPMGSTRLHGSSTTQFRSRSSCCRRRIAQSRSRRTSVPSGREVGLRFAKRWRGDIRNTTGPCIPC